MKHLSPLLLVPLAMLATLHATEFHVATNGIDSNDGSPVAPLRTIQHAADLAQPGDTVTVHTGIYRERINPPRGGTSDTLRITYQAAPGEKVTITGSEPVKNWIKVKGDVWKATLPNSLFGSFNPYSDLIHGDWFKNKKRLHHTGAVYLNGDWLDEATSLEDVLNPVSTNQVWFGQVNDAKTTIWAQFKNVNPNEQAVEINVRQSVFYPDKPARNYISVRGFILCNAATPWAPPTAEQIGLIGTHWSKGWIIENNTIRHSKCSGVSLGKYGDEYDNTSANLAEGYVKTIERAHSYVIPWTKENIGHHIVRNNEISHCEQAGIVGSLGCAYSTVEGNDIHDIHVRRLFAGHEMAGIKFHGAVDVLISNNRVYHTILGLWLDWMTQGTRVSRNLLYENERDLYFEVNHGPFLADNNLLLSTVSLFDKSQGGAYVHNLLAGKIVSISKDLRDTPYLMSHSTAVAGLSSVKGGDSRFYNNLFVGGIPEEVNRKVPTATPEALVGYGLWLYDTCAFPLQTGGNVYFNGARPGSSEKSPVLLTDINPNASLVKKGGEVFLQITLDDAMLKAKTLPVTTALLGKAKLPQEAFENPDGTPLKVDTDYFGKPRSETNPTPGPFENPGSGPLMIKVW
jgi:alpha-N-arabinofuranosidase